MAVEYKNLDSKRLKMYGFGYPGQGFYSINFPKDKVKTYQATGLLTVLVGDASKEKLDKELRNLVMEK